MPSGGPRPGAGRRRGSTLDPMRKGLRAATRARLVEIIERGGDPLSFLISVIEDKSIDLATRLCAAEVVLPYVHPRQNGRAPLVEKSAQQPAKAMDTPS